MTAEELAEYADILAADRARRQRPRLTRRGEWLVSLTAMAAVSTALWFLLCILAAGRG